ncbi:melatonin receptor type 1A-A-like [Amphiura filiformis]|uniref:melatonin receptor type 1A-A-like n=1 Tax=Amphiura filiformis TaxID=82378 RepID=UPI003B215196
MSRFNATGSYFNDTEIHPEQTYLQLYLAYNVLFLIGGFCGNILILSAVKVNEKLHNFGSVFICSLIVADLCVLVLADGFTLTGIVTSGETFLERPSLCTWTSYFCLAACFCAFWSIAAASAHTYLHVCHRFFYVKHIKAGKIATAVACIWIGCGLLLLPSVFGWGHHAYDPLLMYCVFQYTFFAPYTIFLVIFGTIMPLSLTTAAYAGIAHTVIQSRKKWQRQTGLDGNAKLAKLTKPGMSPLKYA